MGLTDVVMSITKKVRRNSPDVVTPANNAWQKVKEQIPGPEVWQKIVDKAVKIVDNPHFREIIRSIPGGPFAYATYKLLQSVQDDEKTAKKPEDDDKTESHRAGTHKAEADAHLTHEKTTKNPEDDDDTESHQSGTHKAEAAAHLKDEKTAKKPEGDDNTESHQSGNHKAEADVHLKDEKTAEKPEDEEEIESHRAGPKKVEGVRSKL